MAHPAKTWRRQLAEWGLLAEGLAYLLGARLALAIFSFRQLTWFFQLRPRPRELASEARLRTHGEVRTAILSAERCLWGQTTCLHRAIAAQAMLRRRGIGATLYYGAANLPGQGLATHAWVQDGAVGVLGYRVTQQDQYHVLARYPENDVN